MGPGFPARFEDTVAWLACHAAVTVLAAFAADHLAVGGR
jgi:hypothetical protein